jgi:hypothetical protein
MSYGWSARWSNDRRLVGSGKVGERPGNGRVAIGRRVLVDQGGTGLA